MTAISICLGSKATATNRGTSLKSFIKEGESFARIEVRIANSADADPFKYKDFGEEVVVQRQLSSDGTSSYRLKSAAGVVKKSTKGDLDALKDHFALQIGNPMTILTQDNARQFLSNSSSKEKYKLYAEGVQLAQLKSDYKVMEQALNRTRINLQAHQSSLKKLENEKVDAENLYNLSRQHQSLYDKFDTLKHQMAWAQVYEQQKVHMTFATTADFLVSN